PGRQVPGAEQAEKLVSTFKVVTAASLSRLLPTPEDAGSLSAAKLPAQSEIVRPSPGPGSKPSRSSLATGTKTRTATGSPGSLTAAVSAAAATVARTIAAPSTVASVQNSPQQLGISGAAAHLSLALSQPVPTSPTFLTSETLAVLVSKQ